MLHCGPVLSCNIKSARSEISNLTLIDKVVLSNPGTLLLLRSETFSKRRKTKLNKTNNKP